MLGDTTDAETAVRLARKLHPDPWQVDSELWNVGNRWCSKRSPNCQHCYLAPHCVYANKQGHEPVRTVAPETGREPPQTSDYAVAGSSLGRAKYLYRLSYDDVEIGTYSWDKADLLAQRIYAARGQDSRGIRIRGAYRDGVVKEWQFSRPKERRLQVLAEEGRELLEQLRRGAIGKRR